MSSREIVTLQIGSCGIHIGNEFWQRLLEDHWLDQTGSFHGKSEQENEIRLSHIKSYFNEVDCSLFIQGFLRQHTEAQYSPSNILRLCQYYFGEKYKYLPRAILIDTDQDCIDLQKTSSSSPLFLDRNMICGADSTSSIWSNGYYLKEDPIDTEFYDQIVQQIRCEVEACDSFQGFQLCHSVSGGTGGGLTSALLQTFNDEYPDACYLNFPVYPDLTGNTHHELEPFNAALTISNSMIENPYHRVNMIIDNTAIHRICHDMLKQAEPKFADLNWIISLAMNDVTASLRYENKLELNTTIKRFSMNLCPFPRLCNVLMSEAPICLKADANRVLLTALELLEQMQSASNFYCQIKSEDGKYLSSVNHYRGNAILALDDENYFDSNKVAMVRQKYDENFAEWMPDSRKSDIVGPEAHWRKRGGVSGCFLANTTAMKTVYQVISKQCGKAFEDEKKLLAVLVKKFEGMEEAEFEEAHKNIQDLITEYQDHQDAVYNSDEEDDEDDEDDDDEDEEEEEDGKDEED